MCAEGLLAQVIRIVRQAALFTLPLFALLPATASAMPPVLQPTATLAPPSARYREAQSVGIDGDYAVVSYYADDFDPESDQFTFEQTPVVYHREANGTWQLMQTLPSAIFGGQFAYPSYAAIRGNVIAFHADDGQLYVFERTASGWQSSPVAEPSYNAFAYATDLEIDNGTVVVAGVVCSEQQVRAYRKNTSGTWARIGTASVAPADCSTSRYPIEVAISGNMAVMGVDRLPDNTGAAYFYGPPSTWSQPVQAVSLPFFDASPVAISGNLSVLSGSELFQRSSGVWTFKQTLPRPEFGFGEGAVEIRGNLVAQSWGHSASVFQADAASHFSEFARLSRPGDDMMASSVDISGRRVIVNRSQNFEPEAFIYELPATLTQPAMLQETFQSGNAAHWTALAGGSWSVATTPVSRVYRQSSLAGNATSLLNDTDWTNQSIQADIKPTAFSGSDRWFGFAVRRVDANNYYYLTARSSGSLQLKKIVNGVVQTLASTPLTVTTGSEYRLRLEAIGSTIRAYVDGTQVLQAIDSSLSHGQAAAIMYRTAADYDNVIVSPSPQAVLFEDDPFVNNDGGWWWTNIAGRWQGITFEDFRVRYQSSAEGPASSVAGNVWTADQSIVASVREAAVGTGTQPWFGLFVRYRDANNYYYVTVRNSNEISLRRLLNGAVTVLDSAAFTVTTGTWYRLRLEAIQDQLRVYVDGRLVLEGTDSAIGEGRYGEVMYKAATMYKDAAVTQP